MVFLECQSFSSQGTVPICDTPLMASFHVGAAFGFRTCVFCLRYTLLVEKTCIANWKSVEDVLFCPRYTLFAEIPCVACKERGQWQYFRQRYTFFEEIVCVASIERGDFW